jgi:hypothetical protein
MENPEHGPDVGMICFYIFFCFWLKVFLGVWGGAGGQEPSVLLEVFFLNVV